MTDFDSWLRALVSTIEVADAPLAEELRALLASPSQETVGASARSTAAASEFSAQQSLRNIVLRVGRPVLVVVGGTPQLEFADAASEVWRSRLQASHDHLRRAARAVGRIDVSGVPDLQYVGTGWLVGENTILTNRHVAREFGRRTRGRFTFKKGSNARPVGASIDFFQEVGRSERLEFQIVEILHIEDEAGPDFALLRVEDVSGSQDVAPPIRLAAAPARPGQQVAVIGYPARDSRVPDEQLMQSIFGDVYDKKRLAPGQVTEVRPDILLHDCSTVGGNSGSVLVDLATGEAIGLHFAGRFLEANYAVPATVVAARLDRLRRRPGSPAAPSPVRPPRPQPPPPDTGTPTTAPGGALPGPEPMLEGVPADYVGRSGYDRRFLGVSVPLPAMKNASEVLTFPWNGATRRELQYEHFSVVMSRTRRLCLFSAVNIDGKSPRRFKRPPWRLDPRIPSAQQIREECYGNEPMFSRGHMTRREDPIWGAEDEAALGNSDSMHVTNTVPQMQPFNAGIWLNLESYALDNAREDDMRISVFTGPFLFDDDPVRYGVRIPRSFWKVIAFIHDRTGKLCATGYTMSQEDYLRDEEYVFGQHTTYQTRIADIERRAAVSFGPLSALDPYDSSEEGVTRPLTDPSQIEFG